MRAQSRKAARLPVRVIFVRSTRFRRSRHVRSASNRVGILCTAAKDAKCHKQPFRGSPGAPRTKSQTPLTEIHHFG